MTLIVSRLAALARMAFRRLPSSSQHAIAWNAFHEARPEVARRLSIELETASMEEALHRLSRSGFQPSLAVDIGACFGSWTRMAKSIFERAPILMVEAREREVASLADVCEHYTDVTYRIALLGAKARSGVSFVETAGGTGSSVLPERSNVARETRALEMTTLDSLVGDVERSVLLKLDVQGYELEVLAGASKTLEASEVVILETQIAPYNEGAPSHEEAVRFMREKGFNLYDICGLTRLGEDSRLVNADVMFIADWSTLPERHRQST